MKAWLLLCLLALPALALTPGDKAPDFTLQGSDGKRYQLSEFTGRYVILEWTNDQCPFVQKHYESGNMQGLQQAYTGQGVVWLSVISSAPGKQGHVTAQQANQLSASRGAHPSAVLFDQDGAVGRRYGARTTPHLFIIDKTGTLQYMGGIDSIASADPADIPKARNYVKAAMDALLAGKTVPTPVSRPYGCSVKY